MQHSVPAALKPTKAEVHTTYAVSLQRATLQVSASANRAPPM